MSYNRTQKVHGVFIALNGLFQIDNMDTVTGTEDVLLHLGIPETGLVTEVNAGFEHVAHGDGRHYIFPLIKG